MVRRTLTLIPATVWRLLTGWFHLKIVVQRQRRNNWCWAACSASVSQHYDNDSQWTQCAIVEAVLARPTCCADQNDVLCDLMRSLTAALTRTGNLAAVAPAVPAFAELQAELQRGRPMAARISYGPERAHFIIVTGFRARGEEYVEIRDPVDGGTREMPFTSALLRYLDAGIWTHTYRIQRA